MSYGKSLEPCGGDGQYQKGEIIDFLPIKETDSPVVKKAKYQAEVAEFIFNAIKNG